MHETYRMPEFYNLYTDEQHGMLERVLQRSQEPWEPVPFLLLKDVYDPGNMLTLSCH